jgi:hypothetical protein
MGKDSWQKKEGRGQRTADRRQRAWSKEDCGFGIADLKKQAGGRGSKFPILNCGF